MAYFSMAVVSLFFLTSVARCCLLIDDFFNGGQVNEQEDIFGQVLLNSSVGIHHSPCGFPCAPFNFPVIDYHLQPAWSCVILHTVNQIPEVQNDR